MSTVIDTLIYDRTQADVDRVKALRQKILKQGLAALTAAEKAEYLAGMKGAYNYTDMNRVGTAVNYLANLLKTTPSELNQYRAEKGVSDGDSLHVPYDPNEVSITAKVDWTVENIPTQAEVQTYLSNLSELYGLLPLPDDAPFAPVTLDYLTFETANNIEKLLRMVYDAAIREFTRIRTEIDDTAKSFRYTGITYAGM